MKIKNECIIIKNGKKKNELHNLIMNEYLVQYAKRTSNISNNDLSKINLDCIYLKFDTPLEFNENSSIWNTDFDVILIDRGTTSKSITGSTVNIQYDFLINAASNCYAKGHSFFGHYIPEFYGRKITAIGFGITYIKNTTIPTYAILDVRNYDLYLQENQDFTVTRRDKVISDFMFWSDTVEGAYHLCPEGGAESIKQANIYRSESEYKSFIDNSYGVLYSVGLGNAIDSMKNETILELNNNLELHENKLLIKNVVNADSVAKTFLSTFLPFFPTRSRYKYILLKFKVYQLVHTGTYDNVISTKTDTGKYYYMAIPLTEENVGKQNIEISYERS